MGWHTESTSSGLTAEAAAPPSRSSDFAPETHVLPSSTAEPARADVSLKRDWLTPDEVAQLLGRSTAALAQMRHRGTGPRYTKAASRILYRQSSIVQWLESAERDRT